MASLGVWLSGEEEAVVRASDVDEMQSEWCGRIEACCGNGEGKSAKY